MKLLKDLLKGPGNKYWDLGRILALLSPLSMIAAAAWNVRLGMPIDLAAFGAGLAAILGASAALILVKDRATAK